MIKITGTTETEPDGLVTLHAETAGREVSFGPFDRRALLKALRAEPDETDYREVIEENNRLGKKLAEAISARDAARKALRDVEEAPEAPRDDQDQIDRSWALEKAGEVLSGLAAVGALPRLDSSLPLVALAHWILDGGEGDRG